MRRLYTSILNDMYIARVYRRELSILKQMIYILIGNGIDIRDYRIKSIINCLILTILNDASEKLLDDMYSLAFRELIKDKYVVCNDCAYETDMFNLRV